MQQNQVGKSNPGKIHAGIEKNIISIQSKMDSKGHFHHHPWSVETHTSTLVVNQRASMIWMNQDFEALLGYPAWIVESNVWDNQRIYL